MSRLIGPLSFLLAVGFFSSQKSDHTVKTRATDTSRAPASELSVDEQRLLELTRRQALFLSDANEAFISATLSCARYVQGRRAGGRVQDPVFIMKVRGVLGNEIDEERSCDEILSRSFGVNAEEPFSFRKSFRMLQFNSLLAQSGDVTTDREILEAESIDGDAKLKVSRYDHVVRSLLDNLPGGIARMPKPAAVVLKKAFQTYQDSIRENCAAYLQENRRRISVRFHESESSPFMNNLCGTILYRTLVPPGGPRLSVSDRIKLAAIKDDYLAYASKKRREFREQYKKAYVELLMEHPHYLLVPALELTTADVIQLARTMKAHNEETRRDLRSLRGDRLLSLLPVFSTFPKTITNMLRSKHRWSDRKVDLVVGALTKKLAARELRRDLTTTALAIGGAFACMALPQGKALGVAVTGLAKGACFIAMGTGIDLYFLLDAAQVRSEAFRRFATTPEAEYVIFNVDQIDAENRNVLFSLIFLPLGVDQKLTLTTARSLIRSMR